MKKVLVGLLFLTVLSQQAKQLPPVNLGIDLLSFVDGTDYICIKEIFNFANNNINLIHGTTLEVALKLEKLYNLDLPEPIASYTHDNNHVGLIWFKDGYYSIKQLKEYEVTHPNDPDLAQAVTHCCSHFEKFSEDYVAEIETAKAIMIKIIKSWSELRNRPDSLLLRWSQVSGSERDSLYKTMTSFAIFDIFLDDLLLFLKDLVQNCPKSHKQYREQHKK